MGPTLCWHVHLFQFALTPANPSGLLHRFPSCKKLNQMSSLHPKNVCMFTVFLLTMQLRLCVLLLQGTLKRFIWIINSIPCYSLLLWILGSPSLAGNNETSFSKHQNIFVVANYDDKFLSRGCPFRSNSR